MVESESTIDKVVEEVEKVKKEWDETYRKTQENIGAIAEYGKSEREKEEKNSLARLNGIAQDGLSSSLPSSSPSIFSPLSCPPNRSLRLNLRNANLQAKANLKKAAQEEAIYLLFLFNFSDRELLLGGGEESTARRRNLQTKAGMTSAAESITESLCRTRQLMVQEVERNTGTLMTLDESTGVLKRAESEYKGHRSLLMRTRNLLSIMQRQDVMDRVILGIGFLLFSLAVLYVVSKRIGLLTLQRKITEAIKAGVVGHADLRPQAVADVNLHQVRVDRVPNIEAPLGQRIHDEL
ncbi:hypothetical protein ACSQ67_012506 [Phaseolus vulgaris]